MNPKLVSSKPITRRDFLKTAGITVSAATLACAGAGCSTPAAQAPAANIDTPSYNFGKESLMDKHILVTYATRTGSTVGVASAIGETLGARGFLVDVKPMTENPSIDGYQAVIIGSAVNGAKWLPEAVEFVRNNQAALNQLPVALFSVHCMNLGDDERFKKNRLAYLDEVRPMVKAQAEAWFPGMGMKPEETPGFARWMARTFFGGGEGDLRDWTKIRGWAQAVLS